ncbi:MAG: AbrB/MazE/SpoVT family DNA-binding domain-containing protein [Euryarchaeota archaeon]|nr:AbrB/MazE/SpoVT family DNA-binding domain-containing protein [Euryarchaeota archaeon]
MTHPAFDKMKYYGDSVIGEKGQIVIPAELRKKFGIETGDRFLVMAGEKMGAWGLMLVKADVLSRIVEDVFGGRLEEVLARSRAEETRPSEALQE